MSYTTELRELKPIYNHRDNLGRGERITLKKVVARVKDRKNKSDSMPNQYEFTFTVGDDGLVKLSKIEDTTNDPNSIYGARLIRTLPIAERAVSEYINKQDSVNLALQPTYCRLEMNEQDSCPPITNEKQVQE
jgi:hypothetical protein